MSMENQFAKEDDWLANLKVGDVVIVGRSHQPDTVRSVAKAGKLHVEVDGQKFRRAGGFSVGHGTYRPWLIMPNEVKVEAIKLAERQRRARDAFAKIATSSEAVARVPIDDIEAFIVRFKLT